MRGLGFDRASEGTRLRAGLVKVTAIPGCVEGLSQPALRIILSEPAGVVPGVGMLLAALQQRAEVPPEAGVPVRWEFVDEQAPDAAGCAAPQEHLAKKTQSGSSRAVLSAVLVQALLRLQRAAGLPVCGEAVVRVLGSPSRAQQGSALFSVVWVPSMVPLALEPLARNLVDWMLSREAGSDGRVVDLQGLLSGLAQYTPAGTNTRHLLREAGALGIPLLPLPGAAYLMGWGCRARIFRSTLSDQTSALGTAWSKNKMVSNRLLHLAGIPVPAQCPVDSLPDALRDARAIGYPVVLKPVDLDQGMGVEADLRSDDELRNAYQRSAKYGRPLILEKHVSGEDYRVYVVNGEVMGVAHRVPAQVVGDGVANVTQLVDRVNEERRKAGGEGSVYKSIDMDAEALEMIKREGYGPSSRIPAGKVLRLRRSANSSRGGTSVDVTDVIHPDNVALCVQAAAVMRLDIAGLDLLIPDICRSWRESGAAFCEVNAQPQMGGAHPWIFNRLLRRLMAGDGRVPAVLVLANATDTVDIDRVGEAFERAGRRCERVLVDPEQGPTSLIARVKAAILKPWVQALVVQSDTRGLSSLGLPLDRFDALVIGQGQSAPTSYEGFPNWLWRHVRGPVLLMGPEEGPGKLSVASVASKVGVPVDRLRLVAPDMLGDTLAEALKDQGLAL